MSAADQAMNLTIGQTFVFEGVLYVVTARYTAEEAGQNLVFWSRAKKDGTRSKRSFNHQHAW